MIKATISYSTPTLSGEATYGIVYITAIDTDTGQPANGNNIVVSYTQNINGVVTDLQTTITGQNATIYSGQLSGEDPSYYTSFTITGVSDGPAPPPPAAICDLKINAISVDKPESASGAMDGQITVDATSSYEPILYSNDLGATYQTSATFSGLGGGLVQIMVKDSSTLGCTAQSSVTVPILLNLLVSGPAVYLPGVGTSHWNAAFNPVVFSYQRKDFEITAVNSDTISGNAVIAVNFDITPITAAIAANNLALADATQLGVVLTNINPVYAYVNAGSYKGLFEILSTGGSNQLMLNTPYISTASGFVNINLLRPYYQVRTKINCQDPVTGLQNNIISTNRPDGTGLTVADISNFLQSLLRVKDDSNFTLPNYRDNNLSASYQISYAEYWDGKLNGTQTLTYTQVTNPYYVLYAAKQLGERYGGNLAAYLPFKSVADSSQLAKWVTDFNEPVYSNGYPFDIGFIYGDDIIGLQLYVELVPLDINRNPIEGGLQSNYLLNDDGSWLLNQDAGKPIIAGHSAANNPVPAQLGLNRLLVNTNFSNNVYYFSLTLKYNDGDTVRAVTQTQTIRIDDATNEQSVYLRWIGLSGCWNYYRFVYNQEVSLDVQNAVIIKNYVSDWENQDGIEEVIGKSAGQKIKVIAEDLSVADIKGLQSIKYSPKVQMLVNKNPVKWQTVVLNTATFSEYETLNGQAPFSVTFNLPSINIQTQ